MQEQEQEQEPRPEDRASVLPWFAGALAVFVVVVVGGVVIARSTVRSGRTILGADLPVLRFMAGHRSAVLTAAARLVSTVASPAGLIITLAMVMAYTCWRGRHFDLALLGLTTLLGVDLIDTVGKLVVARARPPLTFRVPGVSASGLSFPSGHAIQSAAVYGVIAVIAWRTEPRIRPLVAGSLAAVMIVAVAAARVYLGVHWISDVLAGALFGVLWLAVVLTGDATLRNHRVRRKATAQLHPRAL